MRNPDRYNSLRPITLPIPIPSLRPITSLTLEYSLWYSPTRIKLREPLVEPPKPSKRENLCLKNVNKNSMPLWVGFQAT